MPRTRVLVVEDSRTVREHICEALRADPELEVVGEAGDGEQGLALCRALRPDVITLDMVLPSLSGVQITEQVMAHFPTPILIVSASTNRGELYQTYDALRAGAVDVLEKPGSNEQPGWEGRLVSAVKLVSRIKVITHVRARLAGPVGPLAPASSAQRARRCQLIGLGASTGGPSALVDLLRAMPPEVHQPVLMVLHIDAMFGSAFADWLQDRTGRRVVQAKDGDALAALGGKVVMAPPGKHLLVRGARLALTLDPERHSCRPSIDVLFESMAAEYAAAGAACLLTGMGRDGASGLLAVRRAGGSTLAQDEASCVVYGMPREAVALGAVERSGNPAELGQQLGELARHRDG